MAKVPDSEFLAVLRETGGLFAQTAKILSERIGEPYSRQAVRQRALDHHKEELEDIEETGIDIAEHGMLTLAASLDEDIKFKACQFLLKTKGKKRGYIERNEITGADGKPMVTETHVKIIRDKGTESPPIDTPLQPAEGTE